MSTAEATTRPRSSRRWPIVVVVAIILVVAVMAGYYFLQPKGTASEPTVNIASGTGSSQSLNFNPTTITVVLGKNNTIVFVNNDTTEHTVSFSSVPSGVSSSSISDPSLAKGTSYTVTLTVAGTYYYKCFIHPWMYGTIIVKSS